MHKSEKNTYGKTFHEKIYKKKSSKADNITCELYAIEDGHEKQIKSRKYKKSNKDLQQKYKYPQKGGRKSSNNSSTNTERAIGPAQRM